MKTIDISRQRATTVAELLELAKKEAGLILIEAGQPVARVIPLPEPPQERVAPLNPGAFEIADDFEAPLPDEFWLGQS
jgi:antitoxin (DNA-binding transcriptional repressor) of toxin-antitoxin stability system